MAKDLDIDFERTMIPQGGIKIVLGNYDNFEIIVDHVPENSLAAAVGHALCIKTHRTVVVNDDFIRRLSATELDVPARRITVHVLEN